MTKEEWIKKEEELHGRKKEKKEEVKK